MANSWKVGEWRGKLKDMITSAIFIHTWQVCGLLGICSCVGGDTYDMF